MRHGVCVFACGVVDASAGVAGFIWFLGACFEVLTGFGDAKGIRRKISQNLLHVSLDIGVIVHDSSCHRSLCEGELKRTHLSRRNSLILLHIVFRSTSSLLLSMSVRMPGGTEYAAL